jgi:hypothetical protein
MTMLPKSSAPSVLPISLLLLLLLLSPFSSSSFSAASAAVSAGSSGQASSSSSPNAAIHPGVEGAAAAMAVDLHYRYVALSYAGKIGLNHDQIKSWLFNIPGLFVSLPLHLHLIIASFDQSCLLLLTSATAPVLPSHFLPSG